MPRRFSLRDSDDAGAPHRLEVVVPHRLAEDIRQIAERQACSVGACVRRFMLDGVARERERLDASR